MRVAYLCAYSTVIRKNFSSVSTFIEEPDSRAQCVALEENVKEFGVTYFGMSDRRQGITRSLVLPRGILTSDLRYRAYHWP